MRHALVHEALANVARGRLDRHLPGQVGLLALPLGRVGHQVVRILGRHQPRPRERQRDPAGVDRDPAAAPLLRSMSSRPTPACWVQHKVAGVCGHLQAARNDARVSLDDIYALLAKPAGSEVNPGVVDGLVWELVEIDDPAQGPANRMQSRCNADTIHTQRRRLPSVLRRRPELDALERVLKRTSRAAGLGEQWPESADPPVWDWRLAQFLRDAQVNDLARRSLNTHIPFARVLERLCVSEQPPVLDLLNVACVPEQEVADARDQHGRLGARLCEHDDRAEVLRAKHLIKQIAHQMDVLVADLNEDRARLGQQVPGNNQSVAQIRQV